MVSLHGQPARGRRGKRFPSRHLGRAARGTPAGFRLLHIGLAAAFLALIAFDNYAVPHVPGVPFYTRTLGWLSPDAFYYWTILHVTLSLVPKPKSSIASHVPAPLVV